MKQMGTTLIIFDEKDPDVLFFVICFLIRHFLWTRRKAEKYLGSILGTLTFSPTVQEFIDFFERKVAAHARRRLHDSFEDVAPRRRDIVVRNTFLNSLKGSTYSPIIEEDGDSDGEGTHMSTVGKRVK